MKNPMPSSLRDVMKITEEARSFSDSELTDVIAESLSKTSEEICEENVHNHGRYRKDLTSTLDDILTSPIIGYLSMLLLLVAVFWITLVGANGLLHFFSDFCSQLKTTL
jgi:Fe2+ transport system protein B